MQLRNWRESHRPQIRPIKLKKQARARLSELLLHNNVYEDHMRKWGDAQLSGRQMASQAARV